MPHSFGKITALFFVCVVFSFFVCITNATAQTNKPTFFFIRDLKEGSSGNDVLELQKLLNKDPDTRIGGTGIGSQGQESSYFGKITKDAVTRFQNKYSTDILRPAGLTQGTGNVGLWTRLKLNQILINAQIAQTPPYSDTEDFKDESEEVISPEIDVVTSKTAANKLNSFILTNNTKDLSLSSLSRYSGKAGSTITLAGTGFAKENTVRLGVQKIEKMASQSGREIKFTIPESTKPGRYDISVVSGGKTSNTMPFMVTVPNGIAPIVTQIEPKQAKFDQEIKVFGQNFTKTDNIISSHLGIIKNISSPDEKTLSFSIPLPKYMTDPQKWFGSKDNLYWPVTLYVINENGISKPGPASSFIINI